MPSQAPHGQSMIEAVLRLSEPGADPRWPLARVAGLLAVERNLMALRSVGVGRVRVACGSGEHAHVAPHFAARRPDPRLPEVIVETGKVVAASGASRTLSDQAVPDVASGSSRTLSDQAVPDVASGFSRTLSDQAVPDVASGFSRTSDDILVLDGRRVYHPELLRGWLRGIPTAAGLYAEDVTTTAGRRQARRAIRQSLRKPTDGWFARTIDRSVSLAISSVLAPFPVHPNVVTLGTLLVGVASGLLAALGTYRGFVAAGALFLLASVLDGVDGEIARMKFQGSDAGQWLDTVCDDLTNAIYLAGVTAGAWHAFARPWLLWAGVSAVLLDVVTVAFLYGQLLTRVQGRTLLVFEERILAPALQQRGLAGLVARLQPFIKRDIYAPLFLIFALAGSSWLALPATAVALTVTLAFLVRDFSRSRSADAGLGAV